MNTLLPIAASCLLAGGAIGYIFGNQGSADSAQEQAAAKAKPIYTGSTRSRSTGSSEPTVNASPGISTYSEAAATPGQTARLQALVELYSGLSSEEFASEADKLRELPFNEQILASYILFSAWAETSPYDALDHAKTKMGFVGGFVRPTILQSWAASDPKSAAQYYESHKAEFAMMGMMGRGRRGGVSGAATIAGEWARQDPEGALAWAKGLEGVESQQAATKALSQIASTDPERAASLTTGLDGEALAQANADIAGQWAKMDWSKTESFIDGLPADQRGAALASAVESLAIEDPQLAATKALEIPEGEGRNEAIESVAQSLAREDPAAAAEWVIKNGNEEAQRGAMRDIMGSWVNQDLEAARDWAVGQPEGRLRDSAVSSLVISDTTTPPEESIKLAESIGDEGSRGWAIGATTMRWMSEDREAAVNYVETSEMIDERMKNRILRRSGE